jgi:flagellar biosynthesis/type III secretory pathway protein FliH
MTAIKLTGVFNENKSIVDKIKKHIATEMQEYKEYMNSDYEDSFQDALYEGRNEYAESLLKQINEWEKS